MPFDGFSDGRQSYLLQKLTAVSGLLASEQQWCKNQLRSPDGSRCIAGALTDARARLVLYHPLLNAANTVTGKWYHRIESFNDAAETDFTTVQAVMDQARFDIAIGALPRGISYALRYRLARALDDRCFAKPFSVRASWRVWRTFISGP
jgi:hypothetical protein